MSPRRTFSLSVLGLAVLGLSACNQSSVAPTSTASPAAVDARPSSAPAGSYTMTFLHNGQPTTTLPAGPGSNMLVKVHVEDSTHTAAQSGSVLYEICTYKSTGKAAPSAACADGTARWKRNVNVTVNPNGDTFAGVDRVNVACVMGWRATYSGSATIAPRTLTPADFVWYIP